jgi:hypothetical protein
MRVLRAFLVAVAALTAGAAMAPGAWAAGDLVLTSVTATPSPTIVGDKLLVTATYRNDGDIPVSDVYIGFRVSEQGIKITPQGLSCIDFIQIACPLPALLPTQSASLSVEVTGFTPGVFAVEVTGSAPDDPTPGNGGKSLDVTVEPKADLKLDLSVASDTVPFGPNATVRALVSNTTSQATAFGAAVRFAIPPEAQIVSSPDGCTGTALNLTCPLGDLGTDLTAQRLLTLHSSQQGQSTISVTTTWARPDPTIVDTQGEVSFSVLPPPDTSGSGTPAPAPTPAPVPTKARAASFATLVNGAPGTGRCVRSRKLSIVLRSIKNVDPVRATIRVTGRKRALVLKGSKAQRPFSLTLPPSGRATVSLTVTLESGRRYTAKRTYRLC